MVLATYYTWNFSLFLVYKNYFFFRGGAYFFFSEFRAVFLWSHSMCFDKLVAFFSIFVCA